MNPILISAAFGLVKGLAERPGQRSARLDASTHLVGPVVEEAVYRVAPTRAGALGHLAAFAFAVDHVRGEEHTPGSAAWRLAETFAGGLLYQSAFRRFGFLGAVAAHMCHNLGVSAGRSLRAPTAPRRAFHAIAERSTRGRRSPGASRGAGRGRSGRRGRSSRRG